jgi:Ser/Thr protein kinase RdoA (MazF antagonist)
MRQMKPYDELTRLGRIRRMRQVACTALEQYGIHAARFNLLRQAGNTLFRVVTGDLPDNLKAGDLFEPGQYLLRIHQPGYQEVDAIELELAWLAAMRREADLPVQEPIPTLDGRLLPAVEGPGVPGQRNCSLLRWVKGRSVKSHFTPTHLRAQGRLLARLHNFSATWHYPEVQCKRRFDWDGLFADDVGSDMPNAEAWALLSPLHHEAFSFVAERLRVLMDDWGEGSDVFGLIHGDLGVDANLLFWHDQPRAIDFDDSGYGYWAFDLAVALDACRDRPDYARYRDALLEGYAEARTLPENQAAQIELFLAGLQVYWNLWATGGTHLYPSMLPEFAERMARTADFVVRYARQQDSLD